MDEFKKVKKEKKEKNRENGQQFSVNYDRGGEDGYVALPDGNEKAGKKAKKEKKGKSAVSEIEREYGISESVKFAIRRIWRGGYR